MRIRCGLKVGQKTIALLISLQPYLLLPIAPNVPAYLTITRTHLTIPQTLISYLDVETDFLSLSKSYKTLFDFL